MPAHVQIVTTGLDPVVHHRAHRVHREKFQLGVLCDLCGLIAFVVVFLGIIPAYARIQALFWSSFPHFFTHPPRKGANVKKSDETKPLLSFLFKELTF